MELQGQLRQPSKHSKSGSQSAWKPTKAAPLELSTEKSEGKDFYLDHKDTDSARGVSRISGHSDALNKSVSKKS